VLYGSYEIRLTSLAELALAASGDAIRHRQVLGAVPAGVVQHQHDMALASRPTVRSRRVASRRTADRGRWTGTRSPCRGPAVRGSHVQPGKPSSGPVTSSRLWRSAAWTAPGTRAGQASRLSATSAATHRPARRACRRRDSRAPVPESLMMLAPELLSPASCAGAHDARRLRGWHQRRRRCLATPHVSVGPKDRQHYLAGSGTCASHSYATAGLRDISAPNIKYDSVRSLV